VSFVTSCAHADAITDTNSITDTNPIAVAESESITDATSDANSGAVAYLSHDTTV
jgi:hypothetical protein